MTSLNLQVLSQFREQVYQLLHPSRDAAFEIMDAITPSPGARSAVEVSLAPGMQRKFSSAHKGLVPTRVATPALRSLLVRTAEDHEHFLVAAYAVWALIRLKGKRVLYDAPPAPTGRPGRPPEHGAKLKLNQPASWRAAERPYRLEEADGSWVALDWWGNVHERRWPTRPVGLIRVQQFNPDGAPRLQRPLWLVWTGPTDMDWPTFWKVYRRRVCLESLQQFCKNSLTWTKTRLGDIAHEERWTGLVALAYWQLLLARPAARDVCRPGEKPAAEGRPLSPGRVQRDSGRILAELGTPAGPPKPRGNPRGRAKGYRPAPRPRYPVVCKSAQHG